MNFNLRLAQLVEPGRPWRILTGDARSTVRDGGRTLFEFTHLALSIPADECYRLANGRELKPGQELWVYLASKE